MKPSTGLSQCIVALHLNSPSQPPSPSETTLYDLPDHIMHEILARVSDVDKDGIGKGGLNALRLVNKQCKRVVESCTTKLTHLIYKNGPESFPVALHRCSMAEEIKCYSWNLRSLEGCPDGLRDLNVYGRSLLSLDPISHCTRLERLEVGVAHHISDLSPLKACTSLRKLHVNFSLVEDISVLASMPLLEEVLLPKTLKDQTIEHSIEELSPLSHCTKLTFLTLSNNVTLSDLSPLSSCVNLEWLDIRGISPSASVLPLASCTKLESLHCKRQAAHLAELQAILPKLKL